MLSWLSSSQHDILVPPQLGSEPSTRPPRLSVARRVDDSRSGSNQSAPRPFGPASHFHCPPFYPPLCPAVSHAPDWELPLARILRAGRGETGVVPFRLSVSVVAHRHRHRQAAQGHLASRGCADGHSHRRFTRRRQGLPPHLDDGRSAVQHSATPPPPPRWPSAGSARLGSGSGRFGRSSSVRRLFDRPDGKRSRDRARGSMRLSLDVRRSSSVRQTSKDVRRPTTCYFDCHATHAQNHVTTGDHIYTHPHVLLARTPGDTRR